MKPGRVTSRNGINARHITLPGILVFLLSIGTSRAQWPSTDLVPDSGTITAAPPQLTPLPKEYEVIEHRLSNGHEWTRKAVSGTEKTVYANTGGTYLLRPGRGYFVADDLVTTLAAPCALNELRVRVSGGVDEGSGEFRVEVRLYDACPDTSVGGQEIPGTRHLFEGLVDDAAVVHDLVVDFRNRGICDDESSCDTAAQDCANGSTCEPDPTIIPRAVWVRIRFDTADAGVLVGTPPETGFSADGYDDVFGDCRVYFGGWPYLPHASFWVTLTAPEECPTNFLAYQAAGNPPPRAESVETTLPPTGAFADDITLSVPNCVLDSYELGTIGTAGPYSVDMAMHWPDLGTVIPVTQATFLGRGEGSLEVAHVSIPSDVGVVILESDQPIYLTWALSNSGVSVLNAGGTLAGSTDPWLYGLVSGDWSPIATPTYPTVAYAAVYCRGEAPTGACCSHMDGRDGSEDVCVDAVPVTDCPGQQWALDEVCGGDPSDWPCGTRACCLPDGTCEDLFAYECIFACDASYPAFDCQSDGDCPDGRLCLLKDYNGGLCGPVCGVGQPEVNCGNPAVNCPTYCSMDNLVSALFDGGIQCADGICYGLIGKGPNCAIDARQPHRPSNSLWRFGWDHLILDFDCDQAAVTAQFLEFTVRHTARKGVSHPVPSRLDNGHSQIVIDLGGPIPPGEWTCVQHVPSGREWCAGYLPGDVDQSRLVTARDIHALIDSINLLPGRELPPYATDIDCSNDTTGADILRLIDLLNGAGEFDVWMTRSLPPCPSGP